MVVVCATRAVGADATDLLMTHSMSVPNHHLVHAYSHNRLRKDMIYLVLLLSYMYELYTSQTSTPNRRLAALPILTYAI